MLLARSRLSPFPFQRTLSPNISSYQRGEPSVRVAVGEAQGNKTTGRTQATENYHPTPLLITIVCDITETEQHHEQDRVPVTAEATQVTMCLWEAKDKSKQHFRCQSSSPELHACKPCPRNERRPRAASTSLTYAECTLTLTESGSVNTARHLTVYNP